MNIQHDIENTLHRFTESDDYKTVGKELFLNIIGNRLIEIDNDYTPEEFIEEKIPNATQNIQELFNQHIEKIHFVQQLHEDNLKELKVHKDLHGNPLTMNSFLFSIVRMKNEIASNRKTIYAKITREINRPFTAPTVILFCSRQQDEHSISLSFIYRRQSKTQDEMDVVSKKVHMLHNISCNNPHRAHLDIIDGLHLPEHLTNLPKEKLNFIGLMEAWLKILDIDKLNKNFYDDLYQWFNRVNKNTNVKFPSIYKVKTFGDEGQLKIEDKKEKKESQIIRLITRFMFIWFMKEKGLVSAKLFDENEVDKILEDFDKEKGDNYYLAILQNLFFGTLNTPIKDEKGKDNRKFSSTRQKDHRVFTSWCYKSMLKNPEEFKSIMNSIPFINGGLFECLDSNEESGDKAVYRLDCFNDNPNQRKDLSIPHYLFFGNNEDDGIIDIFNRYKFTVEENTPLDVDVALDPELLGKVFENLLASYNPDTKKTARKSSGSYYTPRPIVDYMVTTSLKEYLKNYLTQEQYFSENLQGNLDTLFNPELTDNPFNTQNTDFIIKTISNIKVLDPAVGSGAFPMEVLRICVELLQKLDPNNKKWKKQQLSKIPELKSLIKDYETSAKISNEKARIKAQEELAERRQEITDNFNHNYLRKLYLIRNNIYGIDKQPIACQITKLRFFISLTIEQQRGSTDGAYNNFGIQPLPNLETNFICADTLINLYKPPIRDFWMEEITKYQTELKKNRDDFFIANTRKKKQELIKKDKNIRKKLMKSFQEQYSFPPKNQIIVRNKVEKKSAPEEESLRIKGTINKIASWNLMDKITAAPWFDPEWMFGISDGFDLVIGNPPYISAVNMTRTYKNYRNTIKKYYEVCKGSWDLYIPFIDRSMDILNKNGSLCFITPNKWINTDYGEKIRAKYLLNIKEIVDTKRLAFDTASVDTIITSMTKNTCQKIHIKEYFKNNFIYRQSIPKDFLKDPYRLDILFSNHIHLLEKIEHNFTTVLSSIAKCEQACAANEYYKVRKIVKNVTNNNIESGDGSYFKFINTGTAGIYKSNWGIKTISYSKIKFLYPAVDKKEFQNIASPAYINRSKKPKIIIKGMNNMTKPSSLIGCLDENIEYLPALGTLVITSDSLDDLLYLSAIINSKFASFYTREKNIKSNHNNDLMFKYYMINTIPLPNITRNSHPYKILISKVRKILSHRISNLEKQTVQEEIDKYLYKLYKLTSSEIAIIEQ